MSKYIRTENGIFDTSKGIYTPSIKMWAIGTATIYDEDIIEESDNLTDLIDGYVTYDINNRYDFFTKKGWYESYPFEEDLKKLKDDTLWVMNNRPDLKQVLYGAIWTDKGLIYVAKLNKDREWKLI